MINSDTEVPEGRTQRKRRVLIVDDHPIFRVGLAGMITESSHLEVCGYADSVPEALDAMRRFDPDLVLLDLSLRGANGLELIKSMKAERSYLAILVISMHHEAIFGVRALKAGALGYVTKSEAMNHVEEAISKVLQGKIYVSPEFGEQLIFKAVQSAEAGTGSPVDLLSDRELEVLQLLGKGASTRSIAETLHLSVKTIETHRAHIKEKLRFRESEEMVKFAIDWVAQQG
ncbi:MAG: response regulator transcription factor [Verrucomicrobia bacterium]|nr:response regulator transcription factor [Verrucomicrobiota bacterium]